VEFEDIQQTLAEQIRSERSRAGLSQEELALTAEVDRTYVSQLERGIANPSLQILYRIAGALNSDLVVKFKDRK
jgi:transcriptional regulator with XRE-family HTH domain